MLADGGGALKPTLVLFPGALGDAVCFEPTLEAVAEGGAVVLFARGAAASAASLFPARPVVRSLDEPAIAALFAPLDDDAPPGADAAWLAGHGRILSFTGASDPAARARLEAHGGRVVPFPRRPGRIHLCDAFLRLATGDERAKARAPRVVVPDCSPPRAPGDRLLLVHPGAGAVARRATFELLVAVAGRWRRGGHGDVGVLVGPADEELAAPWTERGFRVLRPPDAASLAGELARASAFLGNDSGPSHLAASVGLPGLALFRASDPALFAPRSDRFEWLVSDGGSDAADRAWQALQRVVLDSPGGRH